MSAETFPEGTTEQEPDNNMGQENEYTDDVEMDDDVDEPVEKQMKPEMTPEQKADISEKKKVEGNKLYVDKKYAMALQLYTEAIELCPTCAAYYSNRSATHIMMNRFKQALEDARMAIRIDPNFAKGHMREGKCHMSMGEASAAVRSYQMALQLDPQSAAGQREVLQAKTLQQLEDRATACYKKGDFRQVVYCMDRCLEISPGCSRFKVLKAECLALLKRYEESQIIANDLLRFDGMNVDAMYVRGLCLYYEDNMDKAFNHFQQVLRLAPDHQHAKTVYKKAKSLHQKKEAGNEAFRVGKLQDALTLYSEALEIDPNNVLTNSKLYNNRATVLAKQKRLDEAITDCTSAIKLDETYTKAYLRRAKCFMDTEKYEEAVRDYEHVYKTNKTREHKLLVQEAKLELKKSRRKDYYKVLGVSKSATDDEIKKAYKKRALAHHPDRHSNATEENRKEEEKKFKEIGQAYTILSDPKKKARYDSGQDLEDLESPGFNDIDPSQIFQAFFGSGGGGGGGAGGPGYGFHQQQGNFPGGFQFQFG